MIISLWKNLPFYMKVIWQGSSITRTDIDTHNDFLDQTRPPIGKNLEIHDIRIIFLESIKLSKKFEFFILHLFLEL